ncbi:MAG TPA: glycosyl hydrolase family 65 protein [Acidimicrobiales bacterium]|nr:glycosyl hydrolase family 65 protein [Acidimicrobiales bacterium]
MADWDGAVVPDRSSDATAARRRIEALCAAGVDVAIVTGTHMENIDEQLHARPAGAGRLFLCVNRGSQVFEVTGRGPHQVWERTATPAEDAALDWAAARTTAALADAGLEASVVGRRLNRRKIDLIDVPEWADPPKARITELLAAVRRRLATHGLTLPDVVDLARRCALDAGIEDPRITSDAKHVEIGLTDKSDSARWLLRQFAARGVGPGLVLVLGDEFGPLGGVGGSDAHMLVEGTERSLVVSVGAEPEGVPDGVVHLGGGPDACLSLLDAQLLRRRQRRCPVVDEDPAWCFVVPDGPDEDRRVHESQLTIADGRFGTRGALEEGRRGDDPLVVAAGVYTRDAAGVERLLSGPRWSQLTLPRKGEPGRRVLDLRTGVLHRRMDTPDGPVLTTRFASLDRPGLLALRAEGPADRLRAESALRPPRGEDGERCTIDDDTAVVTGSIAGGMAMAALQEDALVRGTRLVERIVAAAAHPTRRPRAEEVRRRVERFAADGFDEALRAHRGTWADRWRDADIEIEGDPEAQLATRFALFHLMASAPTTDEAAIGARGLSGSAYAGHVFWDTDIFVLPFLAATCPPAARAALEYRYRRLPAARALAEASGRAGARFPWESASEGLDVTPRMARRRFGRPLPILTGELEEHIVADVAWATCTYAAWSGDGAFMDGPGTTLVTETARYWASRIELDDAGRGHIRDVIGPDEYHVGVDDNAFTNVMARWNLRRGAELDGVDAEHWRALADALVDGYDRATGLYEQFAGYDALEFIPIASLAPTPVAADLLLGHERVSGSQLIKQGDVLMLHHLVPEETEGGSLAPNLDHYLARTAHGSSLSPAVHAALLARAGRPDEGLELLRLAMHIDLVDLTGSTAGGLHMATLGGIWQALVMGFAGIRPGGPTLTVDPSLPSTWQSLGVRLCWQGSPVGVRAHHDRVEIECEAPLQLSLLGAPPMTVAAPGAVFALGPAPVDGGRAAVGTGIPMPHGRGLEDNGRDGNSAGGHHGADATDNGARTRRHARAT